MCVLSFVVLLQFNYKMKFKKEKWETKKNEFDIPAGEKVSATRKRKKEKSVRDFSDKKR